MATESEDRYLEALNLLHNTVRNIMNAIDNHNQAIAALANANEGSQTVLFTLSIELQGVREEVNSIKEKMAELSEEVAIVKARIRD